MEVVCDRVASGRSLRSVCRDEDIPFTSSAVRTWELREPNHPMVKRLKEARMLGADELIDETIEIADDGSNDWMDKELRNGEIIRVVDHEHITRSRTRIAARQWLASKIAPKLYGDRLQTDHTSSDGSLKSLTPQEIDRKLESILQAAEQRKAVEEAKERQRRELIEEIL